MSKDTLEKAALAISLLIIAAGIWFWSEQIGDAVELLRLASEG